MMIDFSKTIRTIAGEEMKLARSVGEPVPMTLALVAVEALLAGDPELQGGAAKVERFMLASKVQGAAGPIELSPEAVTLIRNCIGKACPTLICGRAFELLDSPK